MWPWQLLLTGYQQNISWMLYKHDALPQYSPTSCVDRTMWPIDKPTSIYDLLDKSLKHSWSNYGREVTPGKVHHCFTTFVHRGSRSGSQDVLLFEIFSMTKNQKQKNSLRRLRRTMVWTDPDRIISALQIKSMFQRFNSYMP
ncbi:hypothetical protein AMECASPLE_035999 [Ameca splendens]|uniref:Uncharacterized protein n=1 Tax=Ameca splendens TaxID=208324 RepID=A0ABV0YW74_9TELE